MRTGSLWARLLGVEETSVGGVAFDEDERAIVASVKPHQRQRNQGGRCGERSGRYDAGEGRRRGRALDLGTIPASLEAEAPRVHGGEHGVVVAAVPWARHDARFTRAFDDALVESTNITIRLLMRHAFGFRDPAALIGLALLSLGGLCPPLPGRA